MLLVAAWCTQVAGYAPSFVGSSALRTRAAERSCLHSTVMSAQNENTGDLSLSTSRRKALGLGSLAALSLMLPGSPAFAKRLSEISKMPTEEGGVNPDETPEERKERKRREREEYRQKQKVSIARFFSLEACNKTHAQCVREMPEAQRH